MNKDLFLKVIRNKVIFSLIIDYIHFIHKSEYGVTNIYKWFEILNKPQILAYHNYEKEFKHYYENNKFYSPRNGLKTHQHVLYNLISTNNLQLLKYLLEDLNVENQYLRKIKSYNNVKGDLLYISLKLNKSEIVNYLTTSPIINKKIEWNYQKAMRAIHNLKDIEFFKYVFNNKVVIEYIDIEDLFEESSFHGRLDIINYLLDNTKIMNEYNDEDYNELHKKMVKKAVQGGHLELLELFYQRGYLETCKEENLLNDALMKNHLHLLDWLNEKHNRNSDVKSNYYAICSGNLELVKWMSKNRPDGFTKKSMKYAAKNCYLDIVQWLHFNRTEGCCEDIIYQCLCSKSKFDFEIMKWLLDNGIVSEILSSEDAENFNFDRIASYGSIELIDYMSKHGFNDRFTSDLMDTACRYGHLELVKWLHENRTEGCTEFAMDDAAEKGNLEVVQWLHNNRTEGFMFEALSRATTKGHFEVVDWLINNKKEELFKVHDKLLDDALYDGVYSYYFIMDNLAFNNRLDLMEQLSFPFSEDAMDYAARNANLEMVHWLFKNTDERFNYYAQLSFPISEDAMNYAARNGDLEMLELFLDGKNVKSCLNIVNKCAAHGHIDTLEWLYNRSASFTEDAWESAAQNDQLETLIWLNDIIDYINRPKSILNNIYNPTIINWLKENRSEFQEKSKKKRKYK